MVTNLIDTTHRINKRKVEREIKKNCKGLDEIEKYFIITASQNKDNFNDVYEFFNKEWVNHCKRIIKDKKWLYTIPDMSYFENRYKDYEKQFDIMFQVKN